MEEIKVRFPVKKITKSYMAEKMKVSKERVLDALKAVGNNREKVMEYLSKT